MKEDGSGLEYRGPFVYRRDGSGDLAFESAAFDGGRLTEDKSYCYLTDHLGSTRAVGGISRYSLEEVVDYSAFGEKSQVSGSSLFRDYFTGKEDQIPEFALPYTDFGARMYSPELHRWLSPDPLSEKYYGSSPYNYCSNNPVIFVDPDGRCFDTIWDVGVVIFDVGKAIYHYVNGDTDKGNESIQAAGIDLVCALLPCVPAGGGAVLQIAKGADKVADASKFLNQFEKAADFGVDQYGALKKTVQSILGKNSGYEVHHLIEKRFWPDKSKYTNKIPSIVLTKEEHQQITNTWRGLHKYGSGYKITASNAEDFLKESKQVYGDDAINKILEDFINDAIEKGIIK